MAKQTNAIFYPIIQDKIIDLFVSYGIKKRSGWGALRRLTGLDRRSFQPVPPAVDGDLSFARLCL